MSSTIDIVDRLREMPSADYRCHSRDQLKTFREELRSARDGAYAVMRRISEVAAGRPLTRTQRHDYDAAARRCEEAGALVEGVEDALADKDIDLSQVLLTTDPTDDNPARLPGDAYAALVGSREAYTEDPGVDPGADLRRIHPRPRAGATRTGRSGPRAVPARCGHRRLDRRRCRAARHEQGSALRRWCAGAHDSGRADR